MSIHYRLTQITIRRMVPGDTFDCGEPIFGFFPRPTTHGDGTWLKPNIIYLVVSARNVETPVHTFTSKQAYTVLGPGVPLLELEV